MVLDEYGILATAKAIRPYLADLTGPGASALDEAIADALNGRAGQADMTARVQSLLEARETTKWFMREVLRDAPHYRPPYHQPRHQSQSRGIPMIPAEPDPIWHAGAHQCPQGDYIWYRPAIGTPVPDCPTHNTSLVKI